MSARPTSNKCSWAIVKDTVYKDRTRKKVKVYILAEETIDGQEFIVLLGDVTALETNRI